MSLFAVGPGNTGEIPLNAALGIGPADVVVSLALVYVLTYLYLQEPLSLPPEWKRKHRSMLLGGAIPLGFAFLGVILYTTLTLV